MSYEGVRDVRVWSGLRLQKYSQSRAQRRVRRFPRRWQCHLRRPHAMRSAPDAS
jgi:hypothetical protein